MAADQDDPAHIGPKGSRLPVVLEENDALFGIGLSDRLVSGRVDRTVLVDRIVRRARRVERPCNASCHVVDSRIRHFAGCNRCFQQLTIIGLVIERPSRLLVEAIQRRLDGAVHRAPVRHYITAKAKVAFQDLVEKPIILAGKVAVDLVVRAHDRTWIAAFDGKLESQQIRHARGGMSIRASCPLRPVSRSFSA